MSGGRPERPIEPEDGPIARLAYDLRRLRNGAGFGSTAELHGKIRFYERSTIYKALGGQEAPSWPQVEAIVTACHGDPADWRDRWNAARDQAPSSADEATWTRPENTRSVVGKLSQDAAQKAFVSVVLGGFLLAILVNGGGFVFSRFESASTARLDGTINTGVERTLNDHTGPVFAVAADQINGRPVVITGSGDRRVLVSDLASRVLIGQPPVNANYPVLAVATTQLDGRPVVLSGGDGTMVRVWDLATGEPVGQPLVPEPLNPDRNTSYIIRAITAEHLDDGRSVVVAAGDDGTVWVWNLVTRTMIGKSLASHKSGVSALKIAELDYRPVVVSTSYDKTVLVSDLDTGASVGLSFTGHGDLVYAIAIDRLEGRPVAITSGGDRTVRVWDLATRTQIGEPIIADPQETVNAIATAQLDDRPVIITGGTDHTVSVWDLATHASIGQPFIVHTGSVLALATMKLNDGRPLVISGSDDQTARVWDLMGRLDPRPTH